MRTTIFPLTFLLSIASVVGQVDKRLTAIQQDSIFAIKWDKEQDSLRKEFYNQPQFISLTYEKNGKQQNINNSKFIISIDSVDREFSPDNSNKYLVDFVVDTSQTIVLKLIIDDKSIQQKLARPTEIENGATVVFGQVTDIYKQSKKGLKKPKNEDDELSEVDKFYNTLLNDTIIGALIRQKKITSIQYVQVTPTVFGCGTTTKYVKYE